jgi:hypothetical protein
MNNVRTTVDIPDPLYRQLKGKAATEGCAVKDLILRSVKAELRNRSRFPRKRLLLPIVRSEHPATLDIDNAKIFEIIPFP